MTMVNSNALAIIVKSSVSELVVQQTSGASGSGRKADSNGGSPEARRLFERRRTMAWDAACERRRIAGYRKRWRDEVGPMLRCVRPRPLRFGRGSGFSFERLVFAEVGNAQSEWIDRNQCV